jgi:serine/threonine protein kinase
VLPSGHEQKRLHYLVPYEGIIGPHHLFFCLVSFQEAAIMADRVGQQLGKYHLTRLLGQGGFAEVYLAVHVHLGTEAAIKVLHTQLVTPGEMEKFRQEAQTIAKLAHPNIVRVLDFDVENGVPYLVMDHAPNGSMRQRQSPGTRLTSQDVLPYLTQVADALQYAHDQKLVHRDIKPENMLLGRRNDLLLTDFGIAVAAQSSSMQKTMGVAGTAAYMSPEQLQGKPRPSSDLYSLAVVVYEWLTGERPFQGGFTEVASQHLFTPPPPLREKVPDIEPAVERVVLTALAKDPKDRFGSVRAFVNAFIQASGVSGTMSTVAAQMVVPPALASQPALPSAGQGVGSLSSAATQQGLYPAGQGADLLYSATTHVTPQLTPQLSNPSQPGPSVLDAPTQFIAPTAATAPGNLVAAYMASPVTGEVGYTPSASLTPTAQNIQPPMQGWAAQIGSGPAPAPLATFETAAGAGGPIVPSPDAGRGPRKGGPRRWLLGVAAALLLVALLGGGVLAYSKLFAHPPVASTGATVTITPKSSPLQNSYNITAVPGSPDASQNQIGEQQISGTTQAYSSTANATGTAYTGGSYAQGTADVYNFDTTKPLNLAAGSSFPNDGGCAPASDTIVLDAAVTNLVAGSGPVTVPVHIQPKGAVKGTPSGCVPLLEYITGNCSGSPCTEIAVHITTNGTDPQPQTVVAQSDIDNTASSLEQANQPNADQVIQSKLQSGEQEIGGTAQCSPNVTSDHSAGDQASTVTVTVTFTCTGEAYSPKDATDFARQLLANDAQSKFGAQYALVGQINSTVVSSSAGNQGTENLVVSASGVWAYQFSATAQQTLAGLIAGKTTPQARQTLLAQSGVADVTIQITGGNRQTLPTKAQEIKIEIKTVTGA